MLVSVTFGNENFGESSCKYQIFACRTSSFPLINPMQKHLWLTSKDNIHGISRNGPLTKVTAAPGYSEELGKWTTATYDLPDQFVLKIFGMRFSHTRNFENLFIKIRENGPLLQINGRTTGHINSGRTIIAAFEGRGDILTQEEANSLGVSHSLSEVTGPRTHSLFVINEIAPEISSKPSQIEETIENTSGKEVKVKTLERKRNIQI